MKCSWIPSIAIVLACGSALAQSPEELAQDEFKRGNTAYNLAHFDEAVEHFTKAYEAWPQPAFLYNIAQAYRLAGNCKQALYFYKRFVSLEDNDPKHPLPPDKRAQIERFISDLTECAEKAAHTATAQPDTIDRPQAPAAPTTTTAPATAPDPETDEGDGADGAMEQQAAPPSGRGMKIASFATAGTGLGLVLTGVAFGMLARSAQADVDAAVEHGAPFDPARDAAGRRDATISELAIGVGAAAIVAGGVLYLLGAHHGARATSTTARLQVVPAVGARTVGLTLDLRY